MGTDTDSDSVDRMREAWARRDPGLDTSPLDVVGRLLLCAHHCERALAEALRPFKLSFADFDVVNTLRRRGDPDGTHPRDLATSALISTGAMTARLDRLERVGLIIRTPDPGDRRAVLVHLTERGEATARQALDAVLATDVAFLRPLDDHERESVAAALKTLLLSVENPQQAR